jgi:hypothetical protein
VTRWRCFIHLAAITIGHGSQEVTTSYTELIMEIDESHKASTDDLLNEKNSTSIKSDYLYFFYKCIVLCFNRQISVFTEIFRIFCYSE